MSTVQQPAGTLCPHFEEIDEELLSALFSKVAKVRSQNKELFEFTHRRITVFDALADEEAQVSEEEIYEDFLKYHQGNFVTVIEGNVGTGKSELCAYVSHQLREDGRPVLHIDKNADLLSIMAEEIPEFYREHIGGDLPGASNVQKLRRHVKMNRGTVARLVVSKAKLNISDLADTTVNFTDEQESQLEGFVKDKLTSISERGELATKVSFVEPGEIETFDYLNVFDTKSAKGAAEAWNNAIWEAVRDEYDSPSMDQLLERVGQAFGEDRPVLVFEDFSISALDAEKLGNYMEDDSPENNWDFIVAGTQDSTEVLRTETGLERHDFYRTNRPDSSSVLFLDEGTCVDFIRPYLGYIKHLDRSVSYERGEDNEVTDILPPEEDSRCAQCGFCDEQFRDLFPLSETFLQRIYEALDEEDQRPRQYVRKVFDILQDYYNEIVDSPASSDELDGLNNPRTPHDAVWENETVRRMAKWYGEEINGGWFQVDYRFVRAFGLTDVDTDELQIEQRTVAGNGTVDNDVQVWKIPGTDASVSGRGGNEPGGNGGTVEPRRTKEEKKIEELKGQLDTWRNNPDSSAAADIDVYMKKGLKDALNNLTDGFAVQTKGSLEYFVGGNEIPFVIQRQGVREEDQIEVCPEDFTPSDLLTLLEYGVYREMSPNEADESRLFEDTGTQITTYAREWQDLIHSTYLESSTNFFVVGATNYTFEDLVVGLYGLAVLLNDPWKEVTAERFAEAYFQGGLKLDTVLKQALGDRLMQDQIEAIQSFVESSEEIESLVEDYFAASENVLDLPRIRELLNRTSPLNIINSLKKGGLKNLPADLRFDSSTSLRDLAISAYDAGSALEDVSGDEDAAKATGFISDQLAGIDVEQTKSYIEKIRTYDEVNPDTKEALGQFSNYSEEEIHEVLHACELFDKLVNQRGTHQKLHATLAGLRVWEQDLTGVLANIELADGDSSSDTTRFDQLSEKYVNK